jgi:hypothetical protein
MPAGPENPLRAWTTFSALDGGLAFPLRGFFEVFGAMSVLFRELEQDRLLCIDVDEPCAEAQERRSAFRLNHGLFWHLGTAP